MKKKIKILSIFILTIFFIIIYKSNVKAASATISASKTSISLGETVTITTTINGASWDISISGAISTNYADTTDDAENATKSFTASFKPTSTGTYTINLSGNVTDSTASVATPVSDKVTINVSQASSGSSSSGSSSSGGSTSNNETTSKESSNANLSNLGIRPNDFSGFTPGTTTYNVTVPEDVESVEVYATAQESSATVSGTGTKTLEYGANALSVTVTAEDGTTKIYTINVTREETEQEEEEQPEEDTEVKNGLSNITIGDLELNPSFVTDVYEYTVKYIGEDTSLDIQAVATDPSYTVEILGNEELKEGENIITILVSDEEGTNVATYQLTVNKLLIDEEALAREEEEKQQQEQRKMFMIIGGIVVVILIIIIVIIIKRRRSRTYAGEFSGVPFAGINDEDDENDNYEDDYESGYIDEQNNTLQEDHENALEENDDNSLLTHEKKHFLDFDDNEEQIEKERAKREFLNGYNTDTDSEDYKEEKARRGRKKGKRFK